MLIKKVLKENPYVKYRKNEKTCDHTVFKKDIVLKLLQIGLIASPKRYRAVIPSEHITEPYGKHVLRGFFDTDGSVVLTKNNGTLYPRLEFKISPSQCKNKSFSY